MDKFLLRMGKFKPMQGRILIVDDNTDLSEIMSIILHAEGFDVKTCDSLDYCDGEIQVWNPDLLLLDVNVNGDDGRIFCSKQKSISDLKIILMSGDETTLDHTHWYGADDCIAKPFDSADLLQKIHFCLEASTKNT